MTMSDIVTFFKSGVKNAITQTVLFIFFRKRLKIIITSTGRSGSTMLFNAIAEGLIRKKIGSVSTLLFGGMFKSFSSSYLEKMSDINSLDFVVYKNHEPYIKKYNNINSQIYLFVYGDPLDSALSVSSVVNKKGVSWFYKHQKNLGGTGSYDNMYKKDVLNYEEIMNSWLKAKESNILCIEYDDLWENEVAISNFIGFDVKLPDRLNRSNKNQDKSKINKELFNDLRNKKNSLKNQYHNKILKQ